MEIKSSLVVPYKLPWVIILSPVFTLANMAAEMAAIPEANSMPYALISFLFSSFTFLRLTTAFDLTSQASLSPLLNFILLGVM